MMKTLSVDIETFSSVNLSKTGVYRYSESPDFDILLFGYSIDGGPIRVADLASGGTLPEIIIDAIIDPTVMKWAFNAQFERVCLSRHFKRNLPPDSWRCTMVWAATLGLPLSLEGVGSVLGLEKQKLKEGKDLIRYFSMPCKPTMSNGERTRNCPCDAPEKWEAFKAYNLRDVEVERTIKEKLAKFPVPGIEWENYILIRRSTTAVFAWI
jgi:DNA polymerase